jgi:preprotein translocase subunit SecF
MNRHASIDFLKYRGLTAAFSVAILAAFAAFSVYNYQHRGYVFSYSVDFTGGTQVLLKFDQDVSGAQVKDILSRHGWENIETRDFSGRNEVLVRVQKFSADSKGLGEEMSSALAKELPGRSIEILQSEAVGPAVGEALRWKSVCAVLIALAFILLYIALRYFSIPFAVGAVVALFHDALVMLAVFAFLDREISVNVIGAILAVLGYSINDTIVIYSRIRDNMKKMAGQPLDVIVNTSLNQTLRRTLLTSVATGLTVGAMFFLGGEGLRNFSLALLVGIIFGTYSSIFIASPIMIMLDRK